VPAYGPQNDVTLKMPAFEWVHVQLHQQKGMISLSPPTICNSAGWEHINLTGDYIWKSNRIPASGKFRRLRPAKVERSKNSLNVQ
ncbi:hypothetical protein, partial [Salmonella enterica]|uniref:hypothetical protein n=1 Tax=Salmonella enterica TaxID=28901 RepID=UPI0039B75295